MCTGPGHTLHLHFCYFCSINWETESRRGEVTCPGHRASLGQGWDCHSGPSVPRPDLSADTLTLSSASGDVRTGGRKQIRSPPYFLRKHFYFLWERALTLIQLISTQIAHGVLRTILLPVFCPPLTPLGSLCPARHPAGVQHVLVSVRPCEGLTVADGWKEKRLE